MAASTKHVAFGGARGGGKSWAVRAKAKLLAMEYPGIRIIVIPDSVTEIGERAFAGCTGLKTVSVLGSVKKLDGTFKNCTALECVTLGVGIKKIEYAFNYCTALKTINVPAKKADYYKKRLPESLHGLIMELPAEKKAKKK